MEDDSSPQSLPCKGYNANPHGRKPLNMAQCIHSAKDNQIFQSREKTGELQEEGPA